MKLNNNGKKRIQEMIDSAFEAYPEDAKGVQVLAKKYLTECDDFELEPTDFEDFEKELSKFFFKMVEEQKPLPADMARLLNEHFWELG